MYGLAVIEQDAADVSGGNAATPKGGGDCCSLANAKKMLKKTTVREIEMWIEKSKIFCYNV